MKFIGVVLVLFALCVYEGDTKKYTTKYDSVNVEMILANQRILNGYIKCLMDEGPCAPQGRELRRTLPDALATGCSRCNPRQKETAGKVIGTLKQTRPKDWDRLLYKYDPRGEFRQRYQQPQRPLPQGI